MTIDEIQAINKVLSGDKQAFQPLVERYSRLVFTSALKIVRDRDIAEDIAQEAFLQAFRSLASFRGDAAFSTWLVRIAVNKALDYCRKMKDRDGAEDLGDYPLAHDCGNSPEDLALRKEEIWQMREQVRGLPVLYRKVVYAYYIQQLSYREIAEREGISIKTVESRLYRARAMLRESVTGGEGENVSTP